MGCPQILHQSKFILPLDFAYLMRIVIVNVLITIFIK